MGKKDPKFDAYIAKSADFARPILKHLRQLVHKGCPEVTEAMKWSFPNFEYKGLFCNMAAFKHHCTFGFWQSTLMKDPHGVMTKTGEKAMGHFGRITSLKDLPSDKILLEYIREAVKLKDTGARVIRKTPVRSTKPIKVPSYIISAIKKNNKALKTFKSFPNSHKKEYVEWIEEAKTDATKEKRIGNMMEWLKEGKPRSWKYMKEFSK